jgi:hypothetical protein
MKRASSTSGLRQLLIADREYRLPGCSKPGPWAAPRGGRDELLDALKSGRAVVVSSSVLMSALLHAGMPCDDYCFGGRHYNVTFLLDQRGQLSEVEE